LFIKNLPPSNRRSSVVFSRPLPRNESICHNILGSSSAKPEGCSVRISAGIPTILTEAVRSFSQSLQSNTGLVPRLGHHRSFPNSLQFPGHPTESVVKQATNPARHAARRLRAASERAALHTSRNYILETSFIFHPVIVWSTSSLRHQVRHLRAAS
jgi:hypothetical protein